MFHGFRGGPMSVRQWSWVVGVLAVGWCNGSWSVETVGLWPFGWCNDSWSVEAMGFSDDGGDLSTQPCGSNVMTPAMVVAACWLSGIRWVLGCEDGSIEIVEIVVKDFSFCGGVI